MKKTLFFKQKKPITIQILGVVILMLLVFISYKDRPPMSQIIVMFLLSFGLIGYSISYEFANNFKNIKHFKLFGLSLIKLKLDVIHPEYISVFAASYKKGSEWGPVAALGNENREKDYVIRLFKGRKHFTVYKAKSLSEARNKGAELAELLQVELKVKD